MTIDADKPSNPASHEDQLPAYAVNNIIQDDSRYAEFTARFGTELSCAISDFIRDRDKYIESSKDPTSTTTCTPILCDPEVNLIESDHVIAVRQRKILASFFRAIDDGQSDTVAFFLHESLVTANTTFGGRTPLLAAISTRNTSITRQLLDLGANPNAFGVYSRSWDGELGQNPHVIERTPLQLAASLGSLPMVKLLVEDYHSDDSIIAPDGQIALRLAAENGHREIVDYLPARRGGGFLRWKFQHQNSVRRIKKTLKNIGTYLKFFLWDVERFLLWTIPKEVIVKPLAKGTKWCWNNRKGFGPWCRRVPGVVWNGIKKIPGVTADIGTASWKALTKDLPKIIQRFSLWTWKLLTKKIPNAIAIGARWSWSVFVVISKFIWQFLASSVSLLHTTISAILTFFRVITLSDIWNGFLAIFRAVFVTFPCLLRSCMATFGTVSLKIMKTLFGNLGECLWFLLEITGLVVLYIPKKLWQVLESLGASFRKAGHEVLIWVKPKA